MQHEDGGGAPSEPQHGQEGRPEITGRVRRAARSIGEKVTGATDALTGAQFQRQFEDFTDTVTTAVVGVHRDQNELKARVDKLEQASGQATPVIDFRATLSLGLSLVLGIIALALGIVALVRTL